MVEISPRDLGFGPWRMREYIDRGGSKSSNLRPSTGFLLLGTSQGLAEH